MYDHNLDLSGGSIFPAAVLNWRHVCMGQNICSPIGCVEWGGERTQLDEQHWHEEVCICFNMIQIDMNQLF